MSAKIKYPKFLFHKAKGDPKVYKLSTDDFFRRIRQEEEATPAEAKEFKTYLEIILSDGEYELQIPDDWEASDKSRVRALYKAVEKAYKLSLDYEADIVEEAEEQKKASEQRGMKMVVAAERGRHLAEEVVEVSHGMGSAYKGKFVFGESSLTLAKGAKVDESDFTSLIGSLLGVGTAAMKVIDKAGFYLVDAIRLAKEAGLDGDQIVEQVADTAGREKFTIQRALRLGEVFPPEKRIIMEDGKLAPMSVHQEIMNYSGGIKDAKKLQAVIEKVKKGKVSEIVGPNGKKVSRVKSLPTKEVRGLLQEASGKTPTPSPTKPKSASGKDANFLYIGVDAEGNEALWVHNDLSMTACESPEVTVVDLATLTKLDKKGMPAYPLKDLPDIWFAQAAQPESKTEKPVKEPKAPKAEKPKADPPKKAEPVVSPSIPD